MVEKGSGHLTIHFCAVESPGLTSKEVKEDYKECSEDYCIDIRTYLVRMEDLLIEITS